MLLQKMKNKINYILAIILFFVFDDIAAQRKYGVMTDGGEIVLPIEYQDITIAKSSFWRGSDSTLLSGSVWKYKIKGKWGLMDENANFLTAPVYLSIGFASLADRYFSKNNDEKWGIISSDGKTIVDYKYDSYQRYDNGLARVKTRGYWGVINTTGEEIIPCIYDFVDEFKNGLSVISKDGEQGIITNSGQIILPLDSQKISLSYTSFVQDSLISLSVNYKHGLINRSGNVIVPFKYLSVYLSKIRLGYVMNEENKYALINSKGKILTSFIYKEIDFIEKPNQYGASARRDSVYDFFDISGTLRITSEREIVKGSDYLYAYCDSGYYRYDYNGNLVDSVQGLLPQRFWTKLVDWDSHRKNIKDWYNDTKPRRYGLHDGLGRVVIPPIYNVELDFKYGYATTKNEKKWGVIDYNNQAVIPFEYDFAKFISENRLLLEKNGRWGIVDMNMNEFIPFEYNAIEIISEDYFALKKGDKYGVMDITGNVLVPFQYDKVFLLDDEKNYYVVEKKGKYGIITKTGEEILPSLYNEIEMKADFPKEYSSYVRITQNKKDGIFDLKTKKIITPCIYDGIAIENNIALCTIKKNGSYLGGMIDLKTGKESIPCLYSDLVALSEDKVKLEKNNRWGVVDFNNNIIIPIEYHSIEFFNKSMVIVSK